MHGGLQTLTNLDGVHGGEVLLECLIDLLLVGGNDTFLVVVLCVVWHDTLEDGRVDVLDDTITKVTEIFEKLVVVGVDETGPFELGVAGLGTS